MSREAPAFPPTARAGRRDLVLVLAPAAALVAIYLAIQPATPDLAAQLLRAKLFAVQGFGLWNNWWYGGHTVLGYSVLFGPLSQFGSPALAGALAALATGALLARYALTLPSARACPGARVRLAAAWLGLAPAAELFSGRLTFSLGLLPAVAAVIALSRRQALRGGALAALSALCSPVAALLCPLAALAALLTWTWTRWTWTWTRTWTRTWTWGEVASPARTPPPLAPGLAVAAGALAPLLALGVLFPQDGTEPFALSTLWPIVLLAPLAFFTAPPPVIRVAALLLAAGCLIAFLVPNPVGSNLARLGTLAGGPILVLCSRRRGAAVLAAAGALFYLQWQAPVRDLVMTADDPSTTADYYRPLLEFLSRQPGPPFRVEIPFTRSHWESYEVAPRFPLARGWERQLDRGFDALFYRPELSPGAYRNWLDQLAVRYVAVPDVALDPSSRGEAALIHSRPPYLRLVFQSAHWRVYAVRHPAPLVSPPGHAVSLTSGSLTLATPRPARLLVRVRYTPYWTIVAGHGCLGPAGAYVEIRALGPGNLRIAASFSPARALARSTLCR